MAVKKTAPTAAEVSAAFRLIADWVDAGGSIPGAVKGGTSTAAEPEEKFDEDEIRGLAVGELRTLAAELGLTEQKVKSKILEEMASKGLFEVSEDEEPEDEEEDEDDISEDEDGDEDEGDEEEELTREDLEGMDLKALRVLAKEEGHERGDYIKADKDAIIDLLLGEDEEEDDEDEEDEDGDEESEELDEEEIRAMPLVEVKKLAQELGVKIPAAIAKNRKKIADKILAEVAEEE